MVYVKNSLIAIVVLALLALTSIAANASLLVEPHLGYIVNSSGTYQTLTFNHTGPQYGARLGFQVAGLMGGVDFTHSTYAEKLSNAGLTFEGERKRDDLGVFIGYSAPVLIRAWLGYTFSAKETDTEDNAISTNGDSIKGHATEFGIGFTPLPLVSLNLTYKMFSYDKQINSGVESAINPKLTRKEIAIGVSFPITLL